MQKIFKFVILITLVFFVAMRITINLENVNDTQHAFGTYIDQGTYEKGIRVKDCMLSGIDIAEQGKKTFDFGCHFDQEVIEAPIILIATLPFEIESRQGKCHRQLVPLTIDGAQKIGVGEEECVNVSSRIENKNTLFIEFKEAREYKFAWQFNIQTPTFFAQPGFERYRLKIRLTDTPFETAFRYPGVKLSRPQTLKMSMDIPKTMEIDLENTTPQPKLNQTENGFYEMERNVEDIDFIQLDVIDLEKKNLKTAANTILELLMGILLGIIGKDFFDSKTLNKKTTDKEITLRRDLRALSQMKMKELRQLAQKENLKIG